MKVVLIKDIAGLGKLGEVHEVKDGYGMNFLIPKRFAAIPGSAEATKAQNAEKQKLRDRELKVTLIQSKADEINGKKFQLVAKAGGANKLYGSVTKSDIAAVLKIDKNNIHLDHPIKETGTFPLELDFGQGIKAEVMITVVAK